MFKFNFKNWRLGGPQLRQAIINVFEDHILFFFRNSPASILFLSIIIGILTAYGAILFRYLILFFHQFFFSTNEFSLDVLENLSLYKRLLLPISGGLVVGIIVTRFAPEVKGSGIPEVIEAVFVKGGMIRFRVLVTKALAAAITIGSGGSAGREGPIVHIGSAIGSAMGQSIGISARHVRTFVACGSAAAVSATFNAPIAGALFAIEVVVSEIRDLYIPPIFVSAVIGTVISRHHLGDFPAFIVPPYQLNHPKELLLYLILGVSIGFFSFVFIQVFMRTGTFFDNAKIPIWIKPAIGGLLVGSIGIFLPHVFGVGYETINLLLWRPQPILLLFLILIAKIFATSLSLGSGGSGGIFAPSLFMGATLGALMGNIVNWIFPTWTGTSGAYALVGMGAMVAGVTHAPISAILIIFELTNNYLIIPPLMVACVMSFFLSRQLNRHSIYMAKLKSKGIHLDRKKDINLLRSIEVQHVMEKEAIIINDKTPFTTILSTLMIGDNPFAIVVNDENKYLGTIELNDIREILPQADSLSGLLIAADIANANTPYVLPNDRLDLIMHIFGRINREELAVCDHSKTQKVIGYITKASVIKAYNIRILQEDLTGGLGSFLHTDHSHQGIEIMPGILMKKIELPFKWVDKTLKGLDLRRRYGLEVVLVQKKATNDTDRTTQPGFIPAYDTMLRPGDQLVILGTKAAIKKADV